MLHFMHKTLNANTVTADIGIGSYISRNWAPMSMATFLTTSVSNPVTLPAQTLTSNGTHAT